YQVLHQASLERILEAGILYERDAWALSIYVAGLAVESLLQAFALRTGAAHDAGHDLSQWLKKCPTPVINSLRNQATEWNCLTTTWSNNIRYLSRDGLLGHLRERKLMVRIKLGRRGPHGAIKVTASRVLEAARTIHGKGAAIWRAR